VLSVALLFTQQERKKSNAREELNKINYFLEGKGERKFEKNYFLFNWPLPEGVINRESVIIRVNTVIIFLLFLIFSYFYVHKSSVFSSTFFTKYYFDHLYPG